MTKVTQLSVAEVDIECRAEPDGDNRVDLEGKMEDNCTRYIVYRKRGNYVGKLSLHFYVYTRACIGLSCKMFFLLWITIKIKV